jgi:translation elongation factor EF-G
LDEKGNNAIVESRSLHYGRTARGILSENGEVYVPPSREDEANAKKSEDPYSNDQDESKDEQSGKADFEVTRKRIRLSGFGLSSSMQDDPNKSNVDPTSDDDNVRPVDAAALRSWKTNLRGSIVAGFQLAIRSGPICEELVRGVMVVLEGVEVAMKLKVPVNDGTAFATESNFHCTKPLSGGMVVATLKAGIRSALL